jgi:two-component system sensor histidine kinase YesM
LQQASADGSFVATEDATQAAPLLQRATPIFGKDGGTAGYLLISVYRDNLRQLLEGQEGEQNLLMLLSRFWRSVYCAQPSTAASLAPVLRQRLLAGLPLNEGGDTFLYTVAQHPATGLYVVLRRPQVFTQGTMYILYTVSLFSALACVLICILMSLLISKQLFSPLKHLRRAIGQVAHNNLDAYIPHHRQDEFGQLADRFNGMLVALRRNQEQLVANQAELNEAQIRMLQAQLNPHFLCNTLDTMKWISKINQMPDVALMSTNLADILRMSISPEEFVPLWREAEVLRRYVEIQNIRLANGLTLHIQLPTELEGHPVPKMMLQPMVENAILHGLEGMEDGWIWVQAEAQPDDTLKIVVSDNGRGVPPELLGRYADRPVQPGHLGLRNVDTILRKHYGEAYGLYIENRDQGTGAVVTATLPIIV